MHFEVRLSAPIILIIIGLGFLLANLDILPLNPWEAFIQYWPALLVLAGIYQLISTAQKAGRGRGMSVTGLGWAAFLILFGFYLLAPRAGWASPAISWSVIWPAALIILGLLKLFQDRFQLFSVKHVSKTAFVGEIHRGGSSWILDDMRIRHGVGEVHLDLTQAIIPEREVFIDIAGGVGAVTMYIPADLPVKLFCELNIGDITAYDEHRDGLGSTLEYESPDYVDAVRKVNIQIQWKLGEIKIRPIG